MPDIKKISTKTRDGIEPDIFTDSFYKNIASSGPGFVAVIDAATNGLLFFNQRFGEEFGCNEQGFIFTGLLDTQQQADRFDTQKQQVLRDLVSPERYVIYQLRAATGDIRTYYLFASPVKDDSGQNVGHVHLMLVPELSQRSLPFVSFDSRELFLEQSNDMGFGTFEWLLDTDQLFWSEGIYRMYEIENTGQELSYDMIRQFTHPDDRKRATIHVKQAIENSSNYDFEMRLVTAKDNEKVIRAYGKIVKANDGRPLKLVGSITDITEQHNIEQNLQKHVEELHRSNQELEEFAYVASHDLQEPLRKITTFCDRLSEKYQSLLTGEGTMYMDRIMASAENMRSLINNLLEFSRVAKSTQPFADVNLDLVLREVKNELELMVNETGTKIQAEKLPVIEGSMSQMKQLFSNIINNAIKFSKPDISPVINISSSLMTDEEIVRQRLSRKKSYYKIQVEDNGIGFDEEYATRIFQIFQRLHGKSEYPGSGIGLAICKKIVERHGGQIYAESTPGQGARFIIILPQR